MTKRFHLRRSGRSAWIALALAVLMVAGAITDALAQTRPRGEGSSTQTRAKKVIVVDCPKEKTKKTTLKRWQNKAVFRIAGYCYCFDIEDDMENARKAVADALEELDYHLDTGKGGKRVADVVNMFNSKSGFTSKKKMIEVWLDEKHALGPNHIHEVEPPDSGSKSETYYCYDERHVYTWVEKMIKGNK